MTAQELEKLKFPIGQFKGPKSPNKELLDEWISAIELFPSRLEKLTHGKSSEELNWKYRPSGWSIKQVIHHCADSHMNSIIRFKLALTEACPNIRPYHEDRWANLFDGQLDDISISLDLLSALHKKWVILLRSLDDAELKLEYQHPEHGTKFNLAETIGIYAWHCNHHFAHVENGFNSSGEFV